MKQENVQALIITRQLTASKVIISKSLITTGIKKITPPNKALSIRETTSALNEKKKKLKTK